MKDDDEVGEIAGDLLKEFQKLGQEYPLITKMFMDMVSIVANHNNQLDGLTAVCEDTTSSMEVIHVALKEHDWKLGVLKKNALLDDMGFPGMTQKRDKSHLN